MEMKEMENRLERNFFGSTIDDFRLTIEKPATRNSEHSFVGQRKS